MKCLLAVVLTVSPPLAYAAEPGSRVDMAERAMSLAGETSQGWYSCLAASARRYASGPYNPIDISTAAFSDCDGWDAVLRTAWSTAVALRMYDFPVDAAQKIADEGDGAEYMKPLRESARKKVIALVVEKRAALAGGRLHKQIIGPQRKGSTASK